MGGTTHPHCKGGLVEQTDSRASTPPQMADRGRACPTTALLAACGSVVIKFNNRLVQRTVLCLITRPGRGWRRLGCSRLRPRPSPRRWFRLGPDASSHDHHCRPAAAAHQFGALAQRHACVVGDNYLGRLKTASGLVREAGLPWVLRGQSEDLRDARQEYFGSPSAQVQTTSQHAQPGRIGCQGWHQRAQRAAHRTRGRGQVSGPGSGLNTVRLDKESSCRVVWRP